MCTVLGSVRVFLISLLVWCGWRKSGVSRTWSHCRHTKRSICTSTHTHGKIYTNKQQWSTRWLFNPGLMIVKLALRTFTQASRNVAKIVLSVNNAVFRYWKHSHDKRLFWRFYWTLKNFTVVSFIFDRLTRQHKPANILELGPGIHLHWTEHGD